VSSSNSPTCSNDLFVIDVLGGKRDGFFVEAGALDGIQASNTLLLERDFGWSGICVEPDLQLFEELVQNRSCLCENVGLYDTRGEVEFMGGVRGWGGVVEHLPPWHEDKWKGGQPIMIQVVPLADLLEQHDAPAVIDYLSLDTEGSEHVILKDFPFNRFHFRVITVESQRCNELLISKGYRLVENPYNTAAPWEQYFVGEWA
jgi:FkbM family methyltransferase